ncbi:hypothetical protein NUH30_09810 [Leptospira sp. 85282-16]|uniref:P-loop ATPase, Sll1717 family n=1 Tax=Leptospira sp. 85282-16 TaxID=2971256 RepID=UPI0021BDFDF6|nr:hypothetical protein [Leptospira sp. 85282-16]MCT8333968.1 hypothetical protein [Leptospira sp. 85282-16]
MTNIKDWLPEFPVSSEDDIDLMKYFISTPQIQELLTTHKWLVLGRKGTGKTAIYKYLQSDIFLNTQNRITVPLNFKEYPWPIHKLYKETMEGEINAYYRSWNYIITVESLSRLIEHLEVTKIGLNDQLKKAKKIIEKIYDNPIPSLIEVIKSKIARVKAIKLPTGEIDDISLDSGSISFEEISKSDSMLTALRSNSFALHDYFYNVLTNNIGNYEILVTLDQLDENWLEGEIQEYSKILVNLITACKSINSEYLSKKKKFKCILFLRTDIYETLRFNDKNKVHQSSAIEIKWDDTNLNDMFFQRILKYKPPTVSIEETRKSSSIFEIKYVKHGATPFGHILRMSFYRPRDIIVYFNKIRSAYTSTKSGLYSSKQLYTAERDYSLSLYNELIDEWANQKPEVELYLNILQNIGNQKFTYAEFEEVFLRKEPRADKSEITNALNFLFQNSIIGQKIQAIWEYFCSNPYMQINFSKEFHVNNGLKNRLVLSEKRAKIKEITE